MLIPLAIISASVLASGLILLIQLRAAAQYREQVREEHRLRMRSTLDHVQDYFDAVYTTLQVVSLDDHVKAMDKGSRAFISELYEHQWEKHRLSEVYIIERDFPGTRRPFQTFEHEKEEEEGTHSQAREQEEYQTQMEQIRRFVADTNLPALISPEIQLCVNGEDGRRTQGLVYSVPILGREGLKGIVAGMVPAHIIEEVLEKDRFPEAALLVNQRGEFFGQGRKDPRMMSALRTRLGEEPVGSVFTGESASFRAGPWTVLWTPVTVVASEKWWLLYLCDEKQDLQRGLFQGKLGGFVAPFSLLLVGVAMAIAAFASGKRLEEQVQHLREREELQHQVQAVSEREQRRIGGTLHEDLCQRLTGLEAVGKVLEKRLKTNSPDESKLATELVSEVRETLGCARELADELQPVSLLAEGFVAAVGALAERAQQHSAIRCHVQEQGFPPIEDPATAMQLYRIVQEALDNAVKHAHATEILVVLTADAREIRVAVKDNGKGMQDHGRGAGMGLRIMRYRSERINGYLEIDKTPGGGTTVLCRCPRP